MAVLVFQHSADAGPGRIGLTLRDHGVHLDIRRLDLDPHLRGGGAGTGVGGLGGIPADFDNVEGVIALGGGQNVGESHPWMEGEIEFLREAHRRQLPLVGVCLGSQLIAHALGGVVARMEKPELGFVMVHQHPVANTETMLAGIPWSAPMFEAHGHEVTAPPPGAVVLQYSAGCAVQSYRLGLRTYAFQYHPEFDRPALERVCLSCVGELSASGVDARTVSAQADEHYQEYARLSDRLCVNLAAFLFPAGRMRPPIPAAAAATADGGRAP